MPHSLLERRDALAKLAEALRDVTPERPSFVVVSGDAGLGKTRLVDEFLSDADPQAQIVRGSAFAATGNTPYGVWIDALGPFLRALPKRDLNAFIGDLPDLARLFQELVRPVSSAFGHSLADGVSNQIVLFGQLRLLLSRIARELPLCLFIDDLHWADRSSIEALHFIVRGEATRPILIVGACRPGESGLGTHLGDALHSLAQRDLLSRLELAPLSAGATGELATSVAKTVLSPATLRELYERTRGNPFFTIELLGHVVRSRPADERVVDTLSLPESIGQLFGAQVTRLAEDPRRIVAVAATIGTRADYDLLRAVTGLDEERLLTGLDELCAARLLDERTEGDAVTYEFRHPLVQEAVYAALGAARRRYLHRLIAAELLNASSPPGSSFAIARHLAAGLAPGRRKDALPHLIRAAYDAIAMFANHEVITFFNASLDSLDQQDEARFDLLRELGEAHKRLGDFERAVSIWEDALRQTSDARGRAILRRCIGRALWQAGNEPGAMAHLEAGVAELGAAARSSEGALLRQELAMERLRLGDVSGALAEAGDVLRKLDPAKDPEAAARLLIVRATAYGYRDERKRARAASERAVRLCETHDLPGAAFLAHYTAASLSRYDGAADDFFASAAAAADVANRMHSRALESWPLSIATERLTFDGRLAEAVASGEAALAIDRTIGQGMVLPRSAAFLAIAKRLTGDAPTAQRLIDEATAFVAARGKNELRTVVVVEAAAAYLDVLDENFKRASLRLDELLARLRRGEPVRFFLLHPFVLPLAAMAALRAGELGDARRHLAALEALRPDARSSARAASAHGRALLAGAEDKFVRALPELQRSIDAWTALGRPLDRARALADLAQVRERRGEREAAIAALQESARTLDEIGAAPDAFRATQVLRRWGVRTGPELERRPSGAAMSPRERQVVKHIARGSLNREIASDLGISELTVETHVRNILRKLGLRSRTQVAVQAAELARDEGAVRLETPST